MKKIFLIMFSAAFIFVGCTALKPMTREEYLDVTQRVYTDTNQNNVFAAAEKLFNLADKSDFVLQHTENSIIGTRQWSMYLILTAVFGSDHWKVSAIDVGGVTKVSVMVTTASSQSLGIFDAESGTVDTFMTPGLNGKPPVGPAVYELFWARMDYLLGKSDKWMTCEDMDVLIKEKKTYGITAVLCQPLTMDNKLPEELRKPEKEKSGPK